MSEHISGGESNFEKLEYVIAFTMTVILTATDFVLLLRSSETHEISAKILHEAFRGFLLSLVASSCVTVLIRWYRHRDEVMRALGNFKALNRYKDIEARITAITTDCLSIRQKDWPPYANNILLDGLDHLQTLASRLKSGKIEDAMTYSPTFFETTPGLSFVTDYGNWEYWRTEHGKSQLDSNKAVLKARPNSIIRTFILPPYETNNGHSIAPSLRLLDGIINEQLGAGVHVRVISESDLERCFRLDVGVFFRDIQGEDVQFVSEWSQPLHNSKRAVLFFEGDELKLCKRMYAALVIQRAAKRIKTPIEWEHHRDSLSKDAGI